MLPEAGFPSAHSISLSALCVLLVGHPVHTGTGTWPSLSSPVNKLPTPASDLSRQWSLRPGAWEAEEPEKQLGLFFKELNARIGVNAKVAAREKEEFFPSRSKVGNLREKEQVS